MNNTQLPLWICRFAGTALVAIASAAPAQEIPGIDQVEDAVIFEYASPGLQLPPAVQRSGLPPRTAQMLGEAYTHPGTPVDRRVELVIDLGRSMLPEAVGFIQSALADDSEQVRAAAARAAAASGQDQLADDLLARLGDPSPRVRAAVVAAHATLTSDRTDASPAILAGLADADPAVRLAAITHIATAQEAIALRDLLPQLSDSPKLEAIAALARVAEPTTVDAVAVLLGDDDIGIRCAAITALGQMRVTNQAGRIEGFLKDNHPTIRRAAVTALVGVHGAERAREIAEPMLDDPDLSVQTAAAAIVTPVRSDRIARALLDRLASPYLPLHDAAMVALTSPADDAVRQVIINRAVEMLGPPDPRRREDAAHLLGVFASDAATDRLIELVGTRGTGDGAVDSEVMREVAEALGRIGDPKAVEVLRSVVERGTAYVLASANGSGKAEDALAGSAVDKGLVALGRIGDSSALQSAMRVLRADPQFLSGEIRAAAAWAVGQLGQSGDNALRGPLVQCIEASDSPETTFEAAKAIGRLGLGNTQTQLRQAAEQTSDPRVRWAALWAIYRLTGEAEPYVTPVSLQRPLLVIQDRAGKP